MISINYYQDKLHEYISLILGGFLRTIFILVVRVSLCAPWKRSHWHWKRCHRLSHKRRMTMIRQRASLVICSLALACFSVGKSGASAWYLEGTPSLTSCLYMLFEFYLSRIQFFFFFLFFRSVFSLHYDNQKVKFCDQLQRHLKIQVTEKRPNLYM